MSMLANPGFDPLVALLVQSIGLRLVGQPAQALNCLNEALAQNPNFLPARFNRAEMLGVMQRYDEALADLDVCLVLQPDAAEILELRRSTLDQAWATLDAQIGIDPYDSEAWFRCGNLHARLHENAKAIIDFQHALRSSPAHHGALNNLGNALLALDRHEEALAAYQRLLTLTPDDPRAWVNHGNVLQCLQRPGEAISSYARALVLQPDFAEAHIEFAHCQLSLGDYAAGWARYEWRWQTTQLKHASLPSPQPLWLGETPLRGRSILLWAEQGYGDAIQFVRFVPALLEQGAHVTLRCPEPLHALFSNQDASFALIGPDAPLPAHDVHCPLLSLPLALGKTLATLAAPPAYLRTDSRKVAAWRSRLGPATRPRIGLVWAGRQQGMRNFTRDMALTQLLPLFALDADFISLQPDMPAQDAAIANSLTNLYSFAPQLTDFAETAALIECLDLVVSVDTAVVHLAGALGKPCHVLLRYAGEWRWLLTRRDSPWYPSLHLHRQKRPGDWADALGQLMHTLRQTA